MGRAGREHVRQKASMDRDSEPKGNLDEAKVEGKEKHLVLLCESGPPTHTWY